MNARERFLETLRFGKPDRIYYQPEWLFGETIKRWQKEGMPADCHVEDFLGFDRFECIPINMGLIPGFEEVVFEETKDCVIATGADGVKAMNFKVKPAMAHYLEFPVKDRTTWENYKEKMNPGSPARYPRFWDDLKRCWKGRDYPLGIHAGSFYGWPRNWIGMESFSLMLYDDPILVKEICDYIGDFVLKVIEKAVSEVDLDFALIWEDLGFKTGPLISPALFREFMLPNYKRITTFLKGHGIDIIIVDSDGNNDVMMPLWIEGGVSGIYPLEVAANSDPIALRKQYSKKLQLIGGIDKRVLAHSKDEIEKEVMSKVPWLLEQGGYIPWVDHAVPPDVPLENYLYYRKLLKEISFKIFGTA